MLRAISWTLRQRRYRAIAIFTSVLALAFVGIGTFEVHRFQEKRHDNGILKSNAHAAVVPLTTAVVPLTGAGAAPADDSIRYRRVSVTGVYQVDGQQYVGGKTQGGRQGFLVLTPLRTSAGTMLVARGFVAATDTEARPDDIAPPPTSTVQVSGRLYPQQTTSDQDGRLGRGEIASVNPGQQADRLGGPVFQAYLALTADQPGTADLRVLSAPDLSNPTGGAGELQLLSYILQWYVFALLALMAPFLFARNEIRDAQRRFLGVDPSGGEFDLEPAARADLPALESGDDRALVLRRPSELAVADSEVSPARQRGERLADRYGRSLGRREDAPTQEGVAPVRREFVPPSARTEPTAPHRSDDAYHGTYNDYLWQLALADGDAPDVVVPSRDDGTGPRTVQVIDAAETEPAADPEARPDADG